MHIPKKVPGLRWITALVVIYAVIWIALEGNVVRVTVLGWGVTLLLVAHVWQRWIAGQQFSLAGWLAVSAALGTISGFAGAVITLIFMAVKTGLHAHGPEFDAQQIDWILGQIPWWTSAGLLVGLGLGLLFAVARK